MTRSIVFTAVLALSGCASIGDDAFAGCPRDLPQSCPPTVPSYQNDIVPIVQGTCYPCHAPGGNADAVVDLSTYANIVAKKGPVLDSVYGCRMPPVVSPPLTAAQRALFLAWFICNAPSN